MENDDEGPTGTRAVLLGPVVEDGVVLAVLAIVAAVVVPVPVVALGFVPDATTVRLAGNTGVCVTTGPITPAVTAVRETGVRLATIATRTSRRTCNKR